MKGQLTARRGSDEQDDFVVRCDSMGQCLKVASDWMLHGVSAGYIRVVFEARGEEPDILAEWRRGYDLALDRDDWSFVLE